jgi:hypothetical protein
VTEERLQKMPSGHYHRLDGKAVVIRSYKGSWKTGETVAFHKALESWPENRAPNAGVGRLCYFFLDDHFKGSIGLDTGDDLDYEYNAGLRHHFSAGALAGSP